MPWYEARRDPEVRVIDRPGQPFLGTGEAAQGPTTAAIANAVADATGARLRELPLTPDPSDDRRRVGEQLADDLDRLRRSGDDDARIRPIEGFLLGRRQKLARLVIADCRRGAFAALGFGPLDAFNRVVRDSVLVAEIFKER